jgi:hypothetical protein
MVVRCPTGRKSTACHVIPDGDVGKAVSDEYIPRDTTGMGTPDTSIRPDWTNGLVCLCGPFDATSSEFVNTLSISDECSSTSAAAVSCRDAVLCCRRGGALSVCMLTSAPIYIPGPDSQCRLPPVPTPALLRPPTSRPLFPWSDKQTGEERSGADAARTI